MVRVNFWLQLLLLVFLLKQSDASANQGGEMQEGIDRSEEDITNTTELKHNNGEQADNCCVSGYYFVHVSSIEYSYMQPNVM